jgi:hypothetical protein
MMREFGC